MAFVYHPKTDIPETAEAIVLRKMLAALSIAAVLVVAPAAAFAADGDYPPPPPPKELSLAGSTAGSVCNGGVPYIVYKVQLNDPGNISTGHFANLVFPDGTVVPLRQLVQSPTDPGTWTVSGITLWPGASVDASGQPTGWPGWEQINGQYVYTGGNHGATRTATSAKIEVNPEIVVPVSYPEETASCSGPKTTTTVMNTTTSSRKSSLSSTGVSPLLLPIGIAAAVLVLLGLVVFLLMRRRTAR